MRTCALLKESLGPFTLSSIAKGAESEGHRRGILRDGTAEKIKTLWREGSSKVQNFCLCKILALALIQHES